MLSLLRQKIHNLVYDKKFTEIFFGSTYTVSAWVISVSLSLLISIIVARFYGAKMLGIVAVLHTFYMLANILVSMGTNTSILRLIPEHVTKYSFSSALQVYRKIQFLVIIIALLFSIFIYNTSGLIANFVFSKPNLTFYFNLASLFLVFYSLMVLSNSAIRGLKLIRIFSVLTLLPNAFNLIILVLCIFVFSNKSENIPVFSLLGSFFLTWVLSSIILEISFRKKIRPNDIVKPNTIKEILVLSAPMLLSTSMTFVISQTGIIMIGIYKTEDEVGYYSLAIKLATLTTFLLSAVNKIAAPKFSELYYSGKIDELFYVAKKSSKLIFWISSPLLFILLFKGRYILSAIYGEEFTIAYVSMAFLVIGQFFNAMAGSNDIFMNMTGDQKTFSRTIMVAAAINVIINMVLVPGIGISGAAIASMLSLVFWNSFTLIYIKSKYGRTIGYFPH
jgi:O-antigen/teichoic acid export membrane protein